MTKNECRLRSRVALAERLWGWKPHPTQREWLECISGVKTASCGRRWGKTEAAAIDAATAAICTPGKVQMIVSPTYDQSKLIFDTVERLMMSVPAIKARTRVVRTPYPKLTFQGHVLTARTVDEDGRNLRGHSAHRVIVDEAAYVRDRVIQEVISPMLADTDGELVMLSTPFGKNHFYRAFVRGRECMNKQYASFSFPSTDNPHISRAYIEQQRLELTPRQFAVEYEAQFVESQSCIFPWDDIEAAAVRGETPGTLCMTPALEYESVVAGVDWARYTDYTAVIVLAVSESGVRVIGMDRFNQMGWKQQIERVIHLLRRHGVTSVLTDQTSLGDPLLEQLQTRLWGMDTDVAVDGYTFTNPSKRDLIDRLGLRLSHKTISIPRDDQLMRELQYFEYEMTEAGHIRMNAHGGHHDDLVTALSLACWQARSAGHATTFLSTEGRIGDRGW